MFVILTNSTSMSLKNGNGKVAPSVSICLSLPLLFSVLIFNSALTDTAFWSPHTATHLRYDNQLISW